MSHFIVKCRVCGRTISQCRCPSQNKPVSYSTCSSCNNSDTIILKHDIKVETAIVVEHNDHGCVTIGVVDGQVDKNSGHN